MSMQVKRVEIELADIPVSICARTIEAAVSHARAGDAVTSAGLEVGRRFTEIPVNTELLQSEPRNLEAVIEVGVNIVGLVRRQSRLTTVATQHSD